jgi:long-chain-alcohol oxidase
MIVLTRDKDCGSVTIDANGQPRIHYRISPRDEAHLMRGMEIAVRVMQAAGAVRIATTQQGLAPLLLGPPYAPATPAAATSSASSASVSASVSAVQAANGPAPSTAAAPASESASSAPVSATEAATAAFLAGMHAKGTQPFTAGMFSAHQMGSCRIGGSAAYAVFDPHGECWEAANLFVADASGMGRRGLGCDLRGKQFDSHRPVVEFG